MDSGNAIIEIKLGSKYRNFQLGAKGPEDVNDLYKKQLNNIQQLFKSIKKQL
jgi:hypothetical protein